MSNVAVFTVLQLEPTNQHAVEFLPVIIERLQTYDVLSSPGESDSSSSDGDDDDNSDHTSSEEDDHAHKKDPVLHGCSRTHKATHVHT